jgi:arsenate reductase
MKAKILFICTHNSARSQMAEGWLRHLYRDYYEAFSGGIEPGALDPLAVRVMKEVGIDISGQRPKNVDVFLNENFDYVMTVCDHAREVCPFFPGGRARLHQSFEDPSQSQGTEEEKLVAYRKVRDEIGEWIRFTFRPT